jgi:hemoglobin-like flavoprotein
MTPHQIALIQGSADVLLSVGDRVVARFYDRLFELAPETRSMFPEDLARQKAKLVETLAVLVVHLSDRAMFTGHLHRLGRHHVAYGVEATHYGPASEALLDSLQSVLGSRFTGEMREAWTALYGQIATAMLAGAQEAQRGAAAPA